MITDVIVIGGGAAGLCAAVYLKQKKPSLSIRVLESLPRVCKKLALTGNGRCNISNKKICISRYHGEDTEFCRYALKEYNLSFCQEFFEGLGVPFVFEGDKAFPASFQASSVVDCLRFAAENSGVITYTETKVLNIQLSNGRYKVICDKMSFLAENIIIATGLLSGGERLGCDGSMLSVLKKAGYEISETTPAIVQVKTETDIVKQLKGIKIMASVKLAENGKVIREEYGEVLFCDYGLSGPPILQVSRTVSRTKQKCEISLDILPDKTYDQVYEFLLKRAQQLSSRTLDEFFTGMLNKRLGQVILKRAGCKLTDKADTLNKQKVKIIAQLLKDFKFNAVGTTGFANSQVTAGGLKTKQFDSTTMMSKSNKGLYAVGEILDIDGDCGGFNLQWAWSSAMCAADSIIKGKRK